MNGKCEKPHPRFLNQVKKCLNKCMSSSITIQKSEATTLHQALISNCSTKLIFTFTSRPSSSIENIFHHHTFHHAKISIFSFLCSVCSSFSSFAYIYMHCLLIRVGFSTSNSYRNLSNSSNYHQSS